MKVPCINNTFLSLFYIFTTIHLQGFLVQCFSAAGRSSSSTEKPKRMGSRVTSAGAQPPVHSATTTNSLPHSAVIVLVSGVVGGLFLIVGIIIVCRCCVKTGAHFKLTLCWLRRHDVARCLGRYANLDCATSTSKSRNSLAGNDDDDLDDVMTDDDAIVNRRKQRALRRQYSVGGTMLGTAATERNESSTAEQSLADDVNNADDDPDHMNDIDRAVARFKESSTTRDNNKKSNARSSTGHTNGRRNRSFSTVSGIASVLNVVGPNVMRRPDAADNGGGGGKTAANPAFGQSATTARRVSFIVNSDPVRTLPDVTVVNSDDKETERPNSLPRRLTITGPDSRQLKPESGVPSVRRASATTTSPLLVTSPNGGTGNVRSNVLAPQSNDDCRRRLGVPPGALVARRSLPTPTVHITGPFGSGDQRAAAAGTAGGVTHSTSCSTEVVVDVHRVSSPMNADHDAGRFLNADAGTRNYTSGRRRSYSPNVSRDADVTAAAAAAAVGNRTLPKTGCWLSPSAALVPNSSAAGPTMPAGSARRHSTSGTRRPSASFEAAPSAHLSSCHQHPPRVRSCDVDGRSSHPRVSSTNALLTNGASSTTRRSSPPLHAASTSGGGNQSFRFAESSDVGAAATEVVKTANAKSKGNAVDGSKLLQPSSASGAAAAAETSSTLRRSPLPRSRFPGLLSSAGRVPRYNDPGSFEEVNEDLLYNKRIFGSSPDYYGNGTGRAKGRAAAAAVGGESATAATTTTSSSSSSSSSRTSDMQKSSFANGAVECRRPRSPMSGEAAAASSHHDCMPTSPESGTGNSIVHPEYRELWELRATIAEQECLAIRLEAASSPEPDKSEDDGQSATTGGASSSGTSPNEAAAAAATNTAGQPRPWLAPVNSGTGDRLSLPVSRRQLYRNVIVDRLNRRRSQCSTSSIGGGTASNNLLPVSPSGASCSIDSMETDGDVSDTSRHDVTTTSFESSTTTTTDYNTDCCLSDSRGGGVTNDNAISPSRERFNRADSSDQMSSQEHQHQPHHRIPPPQMHQQQSDIPAGSGLSPSAAGSHVDHVVITGFKLLSSNSAADNPHRMVPLAEANSKAEVMAAAVGLHQKFDSSGKTAEPDRSKSPVPLAANVATSRTAAKKRRDFRKGERSTPVLISPDKDNQEQLEVSVSSVASATPAILAAAKKTTASINSDAVAEARAASTSFDSSASEVLTTKPVTVAVVDQNSSSDSCRWAGNQATGSRKSSVTSSTAWTASRLLTNPQRRAQSTVESLRSTMATWWYGRHSDAGASYRDYSVDERTNAVFNEFLRYDRSLDNSSSPDRKQFHSGRPFSLRSGDSGSGPHRHHPHRHHNPLHQSRSWRHRVYCSGSTGSTSYGDQLLLPVPQSTPDRRRAGRHSVSVELSSASRQVTAQRSLNSENRLLAAATDGQKSTPPGSSTEMAFGVSVGSAFRRPRGLPPPQVHVSMEDEDPATNQ